MIKSNFYLKTMKIQMVRGILSQVQYQKSQYYIKRMTFLKTFCIFWVLNVANVTYSKFLVFWGVFD